MKNAWIVDSLNLPSQCISKAEIQREWAHLKDVPIDVINKSISILIGADLPHLHICHIFIAILTKLGLVLLR